MSRPIFALVLLVLFYAVAFGLRTWQHLRATGSTGFRGLSGRPGSVEWLGGALFAAGVVLSLAAALGEAAGWLTTLWEPGVASVVLGTMITLGGIATTYLAQVSMGDAWRIGVREEERTRFVTEGPFAVVRNPIFSCMSITAAGIVMLLPNPLSLASLVSLLTAVELQVRFVEEPYLLRAHGPRYRDYMSRVGRFVPRLG
ncbi:MAG TPA: isoprenylcysteine carboxylmethyltransferase family protein [Nannocystis sp.]